MSSGTAVGNIVLVHGGFVDGSGWRGVYDVLRRDGYHVAVVQNPTLSLQGDAAATRMVIAAQDGPVVLVGHFYGGAVITASFASNLSAEEAAFMADAQVPGALDALGTPVTEPAWRAKRSWYVLTTEDGMIPPAAQFAMAERAGSTVVEVPASHAVYVSRPAEVARVIEEAATALVPH
jgi:pimeloyl-ACP methyl ester carboxylesterase